MYDELTLTYPPLLVEGRFTPAIREQQFKEAVKKHLPFFSVEIIPDQRGTRQKMMHLQGEMANAEGILQNPEAIKAFLIEKGFIPESISITKDGNLYATHPREHLPYMHWIVRLLVHFQAFGEWLKVNYWYHDYPEE
ncbi:MAG: hypothetical protein KJ856_10230 [Gammaproteobacteria bacterium]|nr:hypothetical protein [Gammaproteobacteria bacterium]MBU1479389.1 hypothetical protein [Gammaproteobacteria bacterium]MBU2002097.1 hypothetical protein [Gammaproteobacteria bacterium]MBU2133232.1 hypothetical protein [Gammaproteobacteria bacterium]MBU2187376.1 hypothetical protein [Gammaproteobacteria bacterium]